MSDQATTLPCNNQAQVNYRPIPGYVGYRVGDDGSVWSCLIRRGKLPSVTGEEWHRLKPLKDRTNYLRCRLYIRGKWQSRPVHVLVLSVFVGLRPRGMETLHKNGIRSDNRLCNLRWGTAKENAEDKKRHGTTAIGEKVWSSKLTEEQVKEIILRLCCPHLPRNYAELGREFGVKGTTISCIARKITWRHIWDSIDQWQQKLE